MLYRLSYTSKSLRLYLVQGWNHDYDTRMDSTAQIDLYGNFKRARGEERKKIAMSILGSELRFLLRQLGRPERAAGGVTVEAAASALRSLAEMLDESTNDPGPNTQVIRRPMSYD